MNDFLHITKRVIVGVCTLTYVLLIEAQTSLIHNFTTADYYANGKNWCVTGESSGRVLIGNDRCLLRYDGHQWQRFFLPNYGAVRSILPDSASERIYVGGYNTMGYFTTDGTTPQMTFKELHRDVKEDDEDIWNIVLWKRQPLFVGKKNLYVVAEADSLRQIPLPLYVDASAIWNRQVVLAGREGFYIYGEKGLQPIPVPDMPRGTTIRALVPNGDHIIIATETDGLFDFDGHHSYPLLPPGLTTEMKQSHVFCAALQDSVLAIGTLHNGLVLADLRTMSVRRVHRKTGLADNNVLTVRFDMLSNLWVGLSTGLAYVQPQTPIRRFIGRQGEIGMGYASAMHDGRLYLGTNQGVFIDSPDGPLPIGGKLSSQVWTLEEIDGQLLCGSDAGAYIVAPGEPRPIEGLRGTWAFRTLPRHPGYVIGADYDGLFVLRESAIGLQLHARLTAPAVTSAEIEVDDDGSIWLSHWQKGVFRFTLTEDLRAAKTVQHFGSGEGLPVSTGNLLCRINGHVGVTSATNTYLYNAHTRTMELDTLRTTHLRHDGYSLRMTPTCEGTLWLTNENGAVLSRGMEVDNLSFRQLSPFLQASMEHLLPLPDSTTVMNAATGFIVVNNTFRSNQQDYPLFITSVCSSVRDTIFNCTAPVSVPKSLNSIRIDFMLPEYPTSDAVRYECWLEGYDTEWSALQAETYREYSHLPQGQYIFHVRALHPRTGRWHEATLELCILPAWYETVWARILWFILASLIIYACYLVLRWRARREIERMRKQKEEELRRQQQEAAMKQAQMAARQAELERQHAEQERHHAEREREQAEENLRLKNNQLNSSAMELIQKNEMLHEIEKQMSELLVSVRQEESSRKVTQKISSIRNGISKNLDAEDYWQRFENNLDVVYTGFMQELHQRYPDMKQTELRLCACLRMGLSSKEIATLMNTTLRSVESTRYRLRKRLGLADGENLAAFINNIGNPSNT